MEASVRLNWKERIREVPTQLLISELETRGFDVITEGKACLECDGVGAVDGFWLGTRKTCPACHGRGHR